MQERKLTCAIYFIYSHILLNITKYVYSKMLLAAYELREYKLNYNQCYRRHTPLYYTQNMSLIVRSAFSSRAVVYKSVEGYLEQVIIGNILGDAWMERKSKTGNARLRYQQTSPKHRARLYYVWQFYALWCNGFATLITRFDKRSDTVRYVLMFSTRAIPFFTFYYDLFYVNGVKTIPVNIADYLTSVSLAFWIMDDGHINGGLVLNTQGFTVDGVNLLVSALNTNFGLNSYMRYEAMLPVIYIPKKDMDNVRSLVMPHMHASTYYKLGV